MRTIGLSSLPVSVSFTFLDNGLTVGSCRATSHFAEVRRVVAVGSMDDGKHPGISHFVEHSLFEGPTRDGVHPAMRQLSLTDITANGHTGTDSTMYDIQNGTEMDIQAMISALVQMTENIVATEDVVDMERKVILQEIAEHFAADRITRRQMRDQYPNSPNLQHPPGGTAATVQEITLSDVHHHHESWYGPRNSAILISSRLSHEQVLELVCRTELAKRSGYQTQLWPRRQVVPALIRKKYFDPYEPNEVSIYTPVNGWLSPRERLLLNMVTDLLTSAPYGILHQKLRTERSLVYSIEVDIGECPFSDIKCMARTNPRHMARVEEEYLRAIRQIAQGDYQDKLLEYVRHRYQNSVIAVRETSTLHGCLDAMERTWLADNLEDHEDITPLSIIESATRDDLASVTRKYLLDKPYGRQKVIQGRRR